MMSIPPPTPLQDTYLQTRANTHIRNAFLNANAAGGVQVAGVGTTKTGYVIRFKDQQSTETARTNTEWLEELGNGMKMVKPRFGVVVPRTPTEDFSLPENNFLHICRHVGTTSLGVIKGVSDLGDSAKGHGEADINYAALCNVAQAIET
jgi:hypothetical protein